MNYGKLNEHTVGIVMKEAVRRAIVAIRTRRMEFEIHEKEGTTGKMDDVFTSADTAAQEVYIKLLTECFPGYGIVAEEEKLRIPASGKQSIFYH